MLNTGKSSTALAPFPWHQRGRAGRSWFQTGGTGRGRGPAGQAGGSSGLVFEQRLDSLVLEGFSNPDDAVILKPGLLLGRTLAAKAVWGF